MKGETKMKVVEKIVRMAELNHLLDGYHHIGMNEDRFTLEQEYEKLAGELEIIFNPGPDNIEKYDKIIDNNPIPNGLFKVLADGVKDLQNIQMEATKK